MKKLFLFVIFLVSVILMGSVMAEATFTLSSKTIQEGTFLSNEQVYNGFGCSGKNIAPDLEWSNPPDGTKSYAIIMHDPDAPHSGGWYHWIITNIPAAKTGIAKNEQIAGTVLSKTTFGTTGYGGACPPVGNGRHRYIFTVYALDAAKIDSKPELAAKQIETLIKPYILGKASITAYYERK